MKKTVAIFLIGVVLLFSLCACAGNNESSDPASTDTSSTTRSQASETLSEKLIREIDTDYLEKQNLSEYSSTIGMIELAEDYTAKWAQVADEYYDKIMKYNASAKVDGKNYSAEELHTYVADMKTTTLADNDKKLQDRIAELQNTYDGGSIIGPLAANFEYQLQKEWALKLVGIYEQLEG